MLKRNKTSKGVTDMAWILGSVSREELKSLKAAGWEDEDPPVGFENEDYDGDNVMRMFWVDSDVFTIMSGPDWDPVPANPGLEYTRDYTVLLHRPEHITADFTDTYQAYVTATDPVDAVTAARKLAADADGYPEDAALYTPLMVCHGKIQNMTPSEDADGVPS